MGLFYILDDDNNVVEVSTKSYDPTALTWGLWFEKNMDKKRVALTKTSGGHRVSTVFIGLNLEPWGDDGIPLVFETMVFTDESFDEVYVRRYATWDEAVLGHKEVVNKWEQI